MASMKKGLSVESLLEKVSFPLIINHPRASLAPRDVLYVLCAIIDPTQ